jgi:hypothetical protein
MFPFLPSFSDFYSGGDDDNNNSSGGGGSSNNNNDDPLLVCFDTGKSDKNKETRRQQHQQQQHRRKVATSIVLKMDAFSGALQVPVYQSMPRDTCPLLRNCWSQNWEKVVEICTVEPHRALHRTQHSGRTALHLSTFSRPCPLHVAQTLLAANRHMILVQDTNLYTPLHIIAHFQHDNSNNNNNNTRTNTNDDDDEETKRMSLFCDTAIMVEQELQNGDLIPPAYGLSPLYLAAKRNASLSVLAVLLQTRNRTQWVAPSTGGEPYWDDHTLDEYSSPLEVLLRNRATKYMNTDWIRTRPRLIQKLRHVAFQRLSRRRRTVHHHRGVGSTTSSKTPEAETRIVDDDNNTGEELKHTQDQKNVNIDTSVDDLAVMEHECMLLWEKCIELLVGYCPLLEVGDDESHIPYGVLHAVTCCKVPNPSLVQIVLVVFPEQAWQRDEQGMIPLHHVLCGNHKYATTALLDILLSDATTTRTALISFPNNGPTPLAFALKRGLPMDGVIQKLLDADSDGTLHAVDPSTRLYPFCLAALSKSKSKGIRGRDSDDGKEANKDDANGINNVESLAVGTECSNWDNKTASQHKINTENNNTNDSHSTGESLYELDVIYRLLSAHPQVLSQL